MIEKVYSPGEVCQNLGIQFYTLAYLESTGQIPKAPRTGANRRYYTGDLVEQIRVIIQERKQRGRNENENQ